ncbi:hypothetical protein JTS93_07535 [Clostridium botulinum]|nr:hypothetical protein [Clostridium botulinum]
MGRLETLEFYKKIYEDILTYDKCECKNYYGFICCLLSRNSKKYFNNNKEMQLLACDLSFDYLEELDVKILIMQYQKTHTKSF